MKNSSEGSIGNGTDAKDTSNMGITIHERRCKEATDDPDGMPNPTPKQSKCTSQLLKFNFRRKKDVGADTITKETKCTDPTHQQEIQSATNGCNTKSKGKDKGSSYVTSGFKTSSTGPGPLTRRQKAPNQLFFSKIFED